jgi:AsmA protein
MAQESTSKPRLNTSLKWILAGVGGAILMTVLVFGYIAATFDPNKYKAEIISAVQKKTGRTLDLKGDISLSFFPTLGAKLGQAALSERNSNKPFASLSSAVVSVKVMPLLSREVIVDAIELKGVRASIERDKSGRFNFDDLTGGEKKPEEPTRVKVDISHVEVSDGELTYIDHATGAQYQISKLDLKTGRIANGVTTPVNFSAAVAAPKQKAQLDAKLKGKLTFDLERKLYRMQDLDFSGKGNYGAYSGMSATAKGGIEARLASNELIANDLHVDMSGKQAGGDMKLKLDAPRLTLTRDKVDGSKVVLDVNLSDPKSKLSARIALAAVQGSFTAMKAGPLDADIETQGGGRTTKAKIAGTLTGNLDAKRFEIPNLALTAKVSDPKIPKGSFDATITGAARADIGKSTAGLDFTGKVDESNVNGKVGVARFAPLALTFDVNADQLDVDKLMGKAPGKPGDAKQQAQKDKDDKIDLSALKDLNAVGSIKVAKLTAMNVKTSQLRADVKAAGGRLEVSPLSAQLYQGTLNGALSANAADNAIRLRQTLTGVAVGPLLHDAAQIDTLEGKGNISVDVTTQGPTIAALKKALNGTAAINLADGAIKGIDIAGTIRSAQTKLRELRGQQVQASNMAQKTDFSELKATFNIKNGVAHNNDLSMKSPLLRVGGEGDIDVGNDRLNYLLKATLVATSRGQGGKDAADLRGLTVPVKLTGALASPQYSLDFGSMVADVAKQQLQDQILKRATGQTGDKTQPASGGGVKDAVKEGLRGLFGR